MSTVLYLLGKLPGVKSLKKRGHKRLRKHLARERGDADLLGIIKTSHGWQLEPLNMVGEGDQRWAVPVDEDDAIAYPADGLPEEPQDFLGTPVAVGYKHYGAATDVPQFNPGGNVDASASTGAKTAMDALVPGTGLGAAVTADGANDILSADIPDVAGDEADADESGSTDNGDSDDSDSDEVLTDRLRAAGRRAAGWPGRRWRGCKAWLGRRWANHKSRQYAKGWRWTRANDRVLVLQQDGDSAWYVEPASYYTPDSQDVVWNGFKGSQGSRFDARGHGGEPESVHGGVSLAAAYGPVIKLLAPVACRIGRNLHNVRLEPKPVSPSHRAAHGEAAAGGGSAATADGGQPVADAIAIEERALVALEDIKLVDDEMATQEYVQTRVEQTLTKANPPGGDLAEKGLKIGLVIVAGLIGAVVFDPGFLVQLARKIATLGVVP